MCVGGELYWEGARLCALSHVPRSITRFIITKYSTPCPTPSLTPLKCVQLLSTLIALMLAPGSPHSLCKAVVNALGNVAACSAQLAGAVVEQQALDPLTRLVSGGGELSWGQCQGGGELGRGRGRVCSPPQGW